MSQNPFSENPYAAPNQPSHQPGRPPTEEMRIRSLARVRGPAILMQVYGVLIALGSMMLLSFPFLAPDDPDDWVVMLVVCTVGAAMGIAIGAFTIVTGVWMKRLQGWGWALASVIVCFAVALLLCPLFFVVGIWPLIVLLDAEVRACFDQPGVSHSPQQMAPPGSNFGDL